MRAPKIHEDMDRYASAGGKIAENFVMDPSIEGLCAVILNPRRRVKDLSSMCRARQRRERREILRRYAPQDDGRNFLLPTLVEED
jgi:hypothetical protein